MMSRKNLKKNVEKKKSLRVKKKSLRMKKKKKVGAGEFKPEQHPNSETGENFLDKFEIFTRDGNLNCLLFMSEKTTEEKVNELIQQSSDESTLITNLKGALEIKTENVTKSDKLSLIKQEPNQNNMNTDTPEPHTMNHNPSNLSPIPVGSGKKSKKKKILSQKGGALYRSRSLIIISTVVVTAVGGLIIYNRGESQEQITWENEEIPVKLYKIGEAMINKYKNSSEIQKPFMKPKLVAFNKIMIAKILKPDVPPMFIKNPGIRIPTWALYVSFLYLLVSNRIIDREINNGELRINITEFEEKYQLLTPIIEFVHRDKDYLRFVKPEDYQKDDKFCLNIDYFRETHEKVVSDLENI